MCCKSLFKKIRAKKPHHKIVLEDKAFKEFLAQKLPMIWIIGPRYSGKSSLAHHMIECSNLRLLKTTGVSLQEAINAFRADIACSYKLANGFVVDGFVKSTKEAKLFAKNVCKPTVVIYLWLSLNAALGRTLEENPGCDLNEARVSYVVRTRLAEEIYKKYAKIAQSLKMASLYPLQESNEKIIEYLTANFGFKFRQINKN